jgi:mono/diheme cytochrome c family protein
MKTRGLMGLGLLVAGVLAVARTGEGAPTAVSDAATVTATASAIAPASAAEPAPTLATASVPTDSPPVGDAVAGKETFTQYCSICHGVGAKGFIGPHIAGIDWTAPGLIAIVRGGVGGYGGMPAFNADAVTDKNIADVAAYLVSLAPASTSKSSTTNASPAATAAQAVAIAGSQAATSTSAPAATSTSAAPAGNAPAPTTSAGGGPAPASSGSSASQAAGDPIHGHQVYSANCAACHGANAQGGVGPALRGEKNRKDTAAAIAWIKNPKLPMPKLYPSVISEKDVEDVAAYVESL